MSKSRLIVVAAVIAIALLILVPSIGLFSGLPHGYSGLVCESYGIEHDYETSSPSWMNPDGVPVEYHRTTYYQGINPPSYLPFSAGNPTGIETQVTSPQYIRHEDLDTITVDVGEPHDDGTGELVQDYTETFVSIVTMEFTIFIETYPSYTDRATGDDHAIYNVKFWFHLYNNPHTVFQGADSSIVAILNLRTKSDGVEILQKGKDLDFIPDAGGSDVELYTLGTGAKLPTGVSDYYNEENLRKFQDVKFAVLVKKAEPFGEQWSPTGRVDCSAKITFELEVLLFGEWERMRPYKEVVGPPVDKTIWEVLADLVDNIWAALMAPIGAIVVVVGVIGTIIVVTRVRGWLLLFAVVVIWIAVIFVLAMLGLSVVEL